VSGHSGFGACFAHDVAAPTSAAALNEATRDDHPGIASPVGVPMLPGQHRVCSPVHLPRRAPTAPRSCSPSPPPRACAMKRLSPIRDGDSRPFATPIVSRGVEEQQKAKA